MPAAAREVPGFGTVAFATSCTPGVQAAFETALARLHNFDGPEEAFQAVAAADPHCAIAWWGAAMTVRGNPLAGAPGRDALVAGQAYVAAAQAAGAMSPVEAGLVQAMAVYYRDPGEPHGQRVAAYEAAMAGLAQAYPGNAEVESLAALAQLEAVDLTDTTLGRQRAAGQVLERVWAANPNHPGAAHYLIHAYDYPALAAAALPAARRYAGIAPAGHHAQHMPSHIYSMLGMWRESIEANEAAAAMWEAPGSAMAQMDDSDAHGMDFIAYARLQLGQDDAVTAMLAAAGPSDERTLVAARYLLERGDWQAAAVMPLTGSAPRDVSVRFVRALGAAHTGQVAAARDEVAALRALRGPVLRDAGSYWAGLVDVYAGAAEAWAAHADGDDATALRLMQESAALDDGREKHILLENKLLPMRELYGELLLACGHADEALAAFMASNQAAPQRFRGLLGAARASGAARAAGGSDTARAYYRAAAALTTEASPGRADITQARLGGDVVDPR